MATMLRKMSPISLESINDHRLLEERWDPVSSSYAHGNVTSPAQLLCEFEYMAI